MKRPPSLPTGRQLAVGLVTACVASAVLAFPAHAAGTNSVAAVQPVINIANAAGGLVVSGTAADDVEQVNVQVVDQDLGSFETFKSLPAPADGITQDWTLKLSEVEVGSLVDGPLEVHVQFVGQSPSACVPADCETPAATVTKDVVAPELLTSEDGLITAGDVVVAVSPEAVIHFTTNTSGSAAVPTTASPVWPTDGVAVTQSQQIRLLAVDAAGNTTAALLNYTVIQDTTTTVTLNPAASPQPAGTAITLTAGVTPAGATGTVEFFDNGNSLGAASAARTKIVTPTVGSHSYTAKFDSATAAFNPSTSTAKTMTISPAPVTAVPTTTTLAVTPSSPQVDGTTLTLTAGVSPSAAGTFEFFDGATSLGAASSSLTKTHTPGIGGHSYTVHFTPADPTAFVGSTSAAHNVTITAKPPTDTTTSLTVTPSSPQEEGIALTLSAGVSPGAAGTFEFFDGATSLGARSSSATKTYTPGVGSHSYTARWTPSDSTAFNGSTSTAKVVDITAKPPVVVSPPVVVPPVVTPPVVIPPVVTPPGAGATAVTMKLAKVSPKAAEYATVENTSTVSVSLKGWKLADKAGHVLKLPSFTLKPGATVKIYTGKGSNSATKLYLGKQLDVWGGKHDTAKLFNAKGVRVALLRY